MKNCLFTFLWLLYQFCLLPSIYAQKAFLTKEGYKKVSWEHLQLNHTNGAIVIDLNKSRLLIFLELIRMAFLIQQKSKDFSITYAFTSQNWCNFPFILIILTNLIDLLDNGTHNWKNFPK